MTPHNIAYLQELVRNGPTAYPGARYVVRDTGERIDLRYNKRADAFLQYGWIVERHLRDGEYVSLYTQPWRMTLIFPSSFVLFNRQPSLHKMSMMSHRVRLMPYSSMHTSLYHPSSHPDLSFSFPAEPLCVSSFARHRSLVSHQSPAPRLTTPTSTVMK